MGFRRLAVAAAACVILATGAAAAKDPVCPNAEVFSGKLITDICWTCILPIRVAGIPLGGSTSRIPAGATKKAFCICNDRKGLPKPGLSISMWQPARMLEVVRKPGCSMALGGLTVPLSDWRFMGTDGTADYDFSDNAFYHVHTYAFPLLAMLSLFAGSNCVGDGYQDFDLILITEIDPTWNNDELAFFTQPEAAIVANPVALSACVADGVASSLGKPIDKMFWCAGTWSASIYPFSGHNNALGGGLMGNANFLAARASAAAHRRGLAWRTMGDDAMCGGRIDPMFPKSQYRWSAFFPVAEANSDHVTGETPYRWGMGRQIPAVGEDALFIQWRWMDCCSGLL
jgi:conjugal transfer pilus assembly protein TraU